MGIEFTKIWAENMPLGTHELYKRANVMAASQAGLLSGNKAVFEDERVMAGQVYNSFMMSALMYRVTRPEEPTETAIDFIMSDDFLYGGVAASLAEADWVDASKMPEVVDGIKKYLIGAASSIEAAVDNPDTVRDFRNGYLTACQLAEEQGCDFEKVFTNAGYYNRFHGRLEANAALGQL